MISCSILIFHKIPSSKLNLMQHSLQKSFSKRQPKNFVAVDLLNTDEDKK